MQNAECRMQNEKQASLAKGLVFRCRSKTKNKARRISHSSFILHFLSAFCFLHSAFCITFQAFCATFHADEAAAQTDPAVKYPVVVEVSGDAFTINRGQDYWISEGQIIEILRPSSAVESAYERIGQARIKSVASQTAAAQTIGVPTAPIQPGDSVRIHPEATSAGESEVAINRGVSQGLAAGWVVTIWRMEPPGDATPSARIRKIIGRALLVDVQSETSTARILGKANENPLPDDLIRVDKQTTVRQKSGDTIYLNVATDLIGALTPGLKVHVFRPRVVMHPVKSQEVIRWQEKVGVLTIKQVSPASYTAFAAVEGKTAGDILPEDLIYAEDAQQPKRDRAYQQVHVLKIEANQLYLNHFEEARKDAQLTLVRKRPASEEIDIEAPPYLCQVNAVYKHIVVVTLLSASEKRPFYIGDKIDIYRAVGE